MIPNLLLSSTSACEVQRQSTRVSYTRDSDGSHFQEKLSEAETKFSLLGNFFLSRGMSGGRVLEVRCARRKEGGLNLVREVFSTSTTN